MNGLRKNLRIKAIIEETKDCKTFVLEPTGEALQYKAGQFLTFIFEGPFAEQRRNYSLSSSPALQEPVTITIKRITNGVFSRKLVDTAQTGDMLTTIGAAGFFTLPEDTSGYDQIFLLAAGSGITPVFSLLKTALHTTTHLKVVLIYSNRSPEDTIFYNALQQLQAIYPARLQIEWLFSNAIDYTKARLSNWLLEGLLKKYRTASLQHCLFYTCGPFNYMLMVGITLLSAGVKAAHIRKEEFVIPQLSTQAQPPDITVRQVKIMLEKKQYRYSSAYPQTILQAAKKAGTELPYSCETGRCGTCAAICKVGQVWMKYNEVLTDEDLQKGLVLTCTGYPVFGDIELDFDHR